eukprot:2885464-Rhodomonas_salina.1
MWHDDKSWDDQDCGTVYPFVCTVYTGTEPEEPAVEESEELPFAPFVRRGLVILDPEGRPLRFDRERNVIRLTEGEELVLDVVSPARSDKRNKYDGTEYVALKHSTEE